jgi:peptidoglycan/LPS O-acetylase OafA/YrhL
MRLTAPATTSYRPDIDGLRAVAVLSVVAYHLNFRFITGGYVGVDIFFVISGFLITSILQRQMEGSRFSLGNFYERRVRRIAPALTAVLLVTTIAAWFFLLPLQLEDYARSLAAAALSVSNILFWRQAGYFATPSEMKPLLHTWSLAVEEQFYLFFPLLLLTIHRYFKRYLKQTIAAIALLSLLDSAYSVLHDPNRTFFLIDTRAWELLIGSLLALDVFPAIPASLRNLSSGLGLSMILLADVLFRPATLFPGPTALLPCIGAALIIAAGREGATLVGKVLSLRPVVFVGLISYSLYLWHWPLLIFYKLGIIPGAIFGGHVNSSLLLDMLIVASLSWQFIEKPFRAGPLALSQRPLLVTAALTAMLFCVFSGSIIASGGAPQRYTPQELKLASYLSYGGDPAAEREGVCMLVRGQTLQQFQRDVCLKASQTKPTYLLFGDSHAAHLWHGLSQAFPELNIVQATASTCKPLLNNQENTDPYCADLRNYIFHEYLPNHSARGVILSAAWVDGNVEQLRDTLNYLTALGIEVYLAGPNASYDLPLPQLLVRSLMEKDGSLPSHHLSRSSWQLEGPLTNLEATQHLTGYISLLQAQCPAENCTEQTVDSAPILCDGNHFTEQGSVLVAERMKAEHALP